MVSACVMWNGATKPFFVNEKGIKMKSKLYKKHVEKELIPDIKRIINRNDWIFVQDSAPSHRPNLVQDFFSESTKDLSSTTNGPLLLQTAIHLTIIFGVKSN